jgi:hypothetical protein
MRNQFERQVLQGKFFPLKKFGAVGYYINKAR